MLGPRKRSDRRKIYFAQPVVKGSFHDHRPDPPYAASPRRRLVADGSGRCRGAGGGHGGRRAENGVRPLRGINHYFFLPEPKVGCQPAVFWLGAAAMTLIFSFLGFLDSRLPFCSPL